MEITLAPDQEKLVKEVMALRGYESEEQAVAAIFRAVEEDYDFELGMPTEVVRAKIQKAMDQSDRGEGIRLRNADEVHTFFEDIKARGRKRLAERKKEPAS